MTSLLEQSCALQEPPYIGYPARKRTRQWPWKTSCLVVCPTRLCAGIQKRQALKEIAFNFQKKAPFRLTERRQLGGPTGDVDSRWR
ncbi:hypothetical protein Esi_0058_0086 [Ectocarpus siliculosus]|uniref:Uncharacterized protein n=1 Tax=Ectocarpus siliculosus TaxID=2880 RepID=D7G4U1_ECTSI|nr:hypothetical protein Esi_0058_0086 [Ectocarpus siliculosus]|eukprot:CBJ27184.1 hypothetical protein Esi_0058_0086 [Ectocarpus siliculosus]